MSLTEEEFQRLKSEILADLAGAEDYFAMRRPGFNIESNAVSQKHGICELSITTDENQGIQFYKKGNAKMLANKSVEIVAGKDQEDEKAFTIVLDAKSGNIQISAKDGDLILQGGNVKIISTDSDGDVFINSKKTLTMDAPEVTAGGTKLKLNATSDMNLNSGSLKFYNETGAAMFASGQDEILSPTLLSLITSFAGDSRISIKGVS